MAIEPAATSARPAVTMIELASRAPVSPAARAKGTVRPSDIPITTSRTTAPAVKCCSTWGVAGIAWPPARRILAAGRADRPEERAEPSFVQSSRRPHAPAHVEREGADGGDRFGHVVPRESSGQEYRNVERLADPPAERPVVAAPGAAELLHRQGGVARVEQDGVDVGRDLLRLGDGLGTRHVDDLDEADSRKRRAQLGVGPGGQAVAELQRSHAHAPLLGGERRNVLPAGEEKRRDGGRYGGRDGGDAVLRDDAGAAGHVGHEAEGRRPRGYGRPRLGHALDAADLDPRNGGRLQGARLRMWTGRALARAAPRAGGRTSR